MSARCFSFGVPPIVPPIGRAPRPLAHDRAGNEALTPLRKRSGELKPVRFAPPRAMALVDLPLPVTPHVFIRGNPGRPGDEVPRRFLTVLSDGEPKPFAKGSGRLELAQAIASKDNPLTARVMANRVWALHFGKGLVRTPGDFGIKGEPPTHSELLDWLASRFIAEGWSVKKLHRTIMLSAAYQQASDDRPELSQADPDNRLVWRMNRRRLDFEAMRDSLLACAGQLDLKMGGRGVELAKPPFATRRAVYGFIDRQNLPGVFRTFDFASPDSSTPQRFVTTVPQQALFMEQPIRRRRAPLLPSRSSRRATRASMKSTSVPRRRAEPAEVDAGLRFVKRSRIRSAPTRNRRAAGAPRCCSRRTSSRSSIDVAADVRRLTSKRAPENRASRRLLLLRGHRRGDGGALQQCLPVRICHVVPHRPLGERERVVLVQEQTPAGRQFVGHDDARLGDDVAKIRRAPAEQVVEFCLRVQVRSEPFHFRDQSQVTLVARADEIAAVELGEKRVAVPQREIERAQRLLVPELARVQGGEVRERGRAAARIAQEISARLLALEDRRGVMAPAGERSSGTPPRQPRTGCGTDASAAATRNPRSSAHASASRFTQMAHGFRWRAESNRLA